MSEFRILDYNYLFDTTVGLSATSSDAAFPVSNIRRHHRSRVWRSSGYFVIGATNKHINFKIVNGGAEKTATLTEGSYTPTTLAAHIKAQMDAAGTPDVFTVSFSTTTGLWTIASSGTYLALLWLTGTNTATSVGATLGFDVTVDESAALTYTGASIALHTEEAVTIDLRTTEDIDSFAMVFDPLEGNKFSPDAVVKLQASQTLVWTAPPVDVTLTYDEDYNVITHFFAAAQSYRYWRVKVVDPRNPSLCVQIPKILLTKATQLGQLPEIGMGRSIRDGSKTDTNEYGNRYADCYPNRGRFDFSYAALSEADLKTVETIYDRVGSVTPIALALDPTATVFDKDRFFMYGYLRPEFSAVNEFYTFFNAGLVLEEAL